LREERRNYKGQNQPTTKTRKTKKKQIKKSRGVINLNRTDESGGGERLIEEGKRRCRSERVSFLYLAEG